MIKRFGIFIILLVFIFIGCKKKEEYPINNPPAWQTNDLIMSLIRSNLDAIPYISSTNPPSAMNMGKHGEIGVLDVLDALSFYNISNVDLSDPFYVIPTEYWVTKTMADSLRNSLSRFSADQYFAVSNDCDDLAIHAVSEARKLNHMKNYGYGIAFWNFEYYSDTYKRNHVCNVFVVQSGDKLLVKHWDYQIGIVHLSPKEIQSGKITM